MKKIINHSFYFHLLGLFFISLTLFLHAFYTRYNVPNTIINSIFLVNLAYLLTIFALPKIPHFLVLDKKYYVLPIILITYSIAIMAIVMLRIEYSRPYLVLGFFISIIWIYLVAYIERNKQSITLHAIPNFDIKSLQNKRNISIVEITNEHEIRDIKHGLIANLHHNLTPEQEKFIADCSINNVRVYHSESIRELIEGKVQTQHLSENSIGALQPPVIYFHIKRLWDSALIILTLPISLPIMLMTAVCIKLESSGSAVFTQERVGQGGKIFKIYKFRSMTNNPKDEDSKFATQEQDRLTKVGKIIRKLRVDELPQFINVLKGDMSLIGPRPEQSVFVKQYEQEIPFYGYRHMVKPGITGWAQTIQGYTDNLSSTREKLAYDLYYIKHLSIWLDINILFKTIKTLLTGFGAK